MNAYLILILALLVGGYLLELTSEALNLKNLRAELPAEFSDVFDAEKYRQALDYQAVSHRFELLRKGILLAITIAFILLDGFNQVDVWASRLAQGMIARGLLFAGILTLARGVVALPFSLYSTFVIEERFGFNRTTLQTFIGDLIKGSILGAILGGGIFAAMIYFFSHSGRAGWFSAWIAITILQLLLTFLAPAVILPLFNKFTPIPEGELRSAIEEYSRKNRFELSGIFTMDSSRRSSKGNAFFTGFGRFRRLVLFDTLVEKQSVEELVSIFAHEVGHYKCGHIPKFMAMSVLSTGVLFFFISLFVGNPELFAAFGMQEISVYASLIFVVFLYAPVLRLVSLLGNHISRRAEFEADQFSARTYGKPAVLASALKKLSADSLSHLTPHPLKVILDYTHPPVLERIRVLKGYRSS